MSYFDHGGNCCGISHVYNFPARADAAWLDCEIELATEGILLDNEDIAEERGQKHWRGKFGHAIEICLTDDQMKEWSPTLKAKGFKLGLRWLNDNSGNYCNLLAWAPKKVSKKRPYKW